MRLDHPLLRVRLIWLALTHARRRALPAFQRWAAPYGDHREAVGRALMLWFWSQLNHDGRRRMKVRLGSAALASALLLMGSISSPIGMGNDGKVAYDMATRTWFGNLVGQLRAAGDPVFDASNPNYNGGAKVDGITDDTLAIQRAELDAEAHGGGTVLVSPVGQGNGTGVAVTSAAINFTSPTARIRFVAYGVTFQPAANTDCFFVRTANGSGSQQVFIYGICVEGQNRVGTLGVRVRDTDHAVVRDYHIRNCASGIICESVTVGRWAERNAFEDGFCFNCPTLGMAFQASGGSNGSLGETHLWNLGISNCGQTGTGALILANPATFYRCRIVGVTIWQLTNSTGLVIDTNVTDCDRWTIDFENQGGTQTGLTGVLVTNNAVGVGTLAAHFGFTGAYATPVSDAFTKGLVWIQGNRVVTTAAFNAAGGILQGWKAQGDTVDRVQFFGAFSGGGGIKFSDGTTADVGVYRAAAGFLGTDYGHRLGVAGVAGATLYSGSGVPSNALGVNGDFYFRLDTPATVNQRLYNRQAGAYVGIL